MEILSYVEYFVGGEYFVLNFNGICIVMRVYLVESVVGRFDVVVG